MCFSTVQYVYSTYKCVIWLVHRKPIHFVPYLSFTLAHEMICD